MKIAILTDTHGGIYQEEAEREGFALLAAPFVVDGVQYTEGLDLGPKEFYEKLESGAEVSTSQSSPGEIIEIWDRLLKDYDQIICIPLSSSLTGAYTTMTMLCSEEPYKGRVFPVDYSGVSITERKACYDAKALIELGYDGAQIKKILEESKFNNIIYLTVPTLSYLKKGGRITPAAAAIGSLLKIKPVLEIDGGKLDAFAKVRTMSQAKEVMLNAIQTMLDERLQDPEAEDSILYIVDAKNEDGGAEFYREVCERWPKAEVQRAQLALAITCHTGPGVLAIAAAKRLKELKNEKTIDESGYGSAGRSTVGTA